MHFSEDMWEQRPNGKRKLKSGAIPTIFGFFLKKNLGTNKNDEISQTLKEHNIHAKEGQVSINKILIGINYENYENYKL